jgi:hypothetical protein
MPNERFGSFKRGIKRREFCTALVGALAFFDYVISNPNEAAVRPSILLLGSDPFSGLNILRARYESGVRPSEDLPGLALSWQLTGRDEFADRAITELRKLLPMKEASSRSWIQYVSGALAFDWLYKHPSFDGRLKDRVANEFLDAADKLLQGPDLKIPEQSSYHNYLLRYLAIVSFSLAAARTHPGTAQRCKDMGRRAQRAFENILGVTQLVTPDGSYHESMDYFRITLAPLTLLAELQRTTAGFDPAHQYNVFGNLGKTYLYKLMPNGTPSREGDNEYPILDDRDTAVLGYAVHRFKDPYSAWLLRSSGFFPQKWVLPVLDFLWNDRTVTPRDPALTSPGELPRQRFFSGVGHLVMLSGWEKDATWIEFDCGPYFSKHQHLSQNHFSIYRRGYLAIDSGADYTDTESPHYLNYYRRTVAHNSVLVYDPQEHFFWSDNVCDAANDGGQRMDSSRFWNTVRSIDDWNRTRELWDLGTMRVVDYKPGDYHYALGDATRAYSAKKLKRFTRELLYIPDSNVLFVFDRVVSTNPDFKKAWLLHSVNEPLLGEAGESSAHGSTESRSAKTFQFEEGDGELLVHCLLPENRSITKRGGPGNEFWTPGDAKGSEWGTGKNWPLEPAEGGPLPDDPAERKMWKLFWGTDFDHIQHSNRKNVVSGSWRVEVSSVEPAREDLFLHLLEIGDRGTTGKKQIALLKGQNVAGAAFESGIIALFNTTDSALIEAEVTVPDIVCKKLMILGLRESTLFELNFRGPNVVTSASSVPPGIEVQTYRLHSNDKGLLTLAIKDLRSVRLRLHQI